MVHQPNLVSDISHPAIYFVCACVLVCVGTACNMPDPAETEEGHFVPSASGLYKCPISPHSLRFYIRLIFLGWNHWYAQYIFILYSEVTYIGCNEIKCNKLISPAK